MTEPLGDVVEDLEGIAGLVVERNAPAGTYSTYRVGGPISVLLRAESRVGVETALPILASHRVATLPIGKGSNLLVSSAGFAGVGILLGDTFSDVAFDGSTMTAGAGASLPVAARASVSSGLTGFEWAVGVPGSIGGAVRMNAGGHGSDMAASLVSVELADLSTDGVVSTVPVADLDLGYRQSNLRRWHVVLEATLKLAPGDADVGAAAIKEIVSWRRAHQPGGANAGSVFTNPPGDSAGRLIDAAGLKGHRVGSAEVSTKHANFIQVDADGTADDVMALMVEVVDRVEKHAGIRLHAETRLVGFAQELTAHVQDVGDDHAHDDATPGGSAAHG